MDQALLRGFEAGVDRRGTGCEKWDGLQAVFGRADVLPLWVADMDFQAPEPVVKALTERAQNGVFGYATHDPAHAQAVADWMRARHNLAAQPDWVLFSPGVVPSLLYGLRALTKPGDSVAIQTPVYGPFFRMAKQAGVEIYRNPLRQTGSGWEMDLDQLEAGFMQGVRALMLCSPHNPVGRIWTKRELTELVALCNRYEVGLLSDEIHMDFELPGFTHTPILSIPGAGRAILLASATKTFNLAGLRHSSILAADADIRAELQCILEDACVGEPNLFGALAQTVAYQQGGPWLDALLHYMEGTRQYAEDFIRNKLPEVGLTRAQGTYLLWMDMKGLGMAQDELQRFLVDKADVGLNDGLFFGEEGAGFVRLNMATPRRNVEEGLKRIEAAVRAR